MRGVLAAVVLGLALVGAGCGTDDLTGAGCVTDLGSGEELCGADAKRFCSELAKQRRAQRRVESHDFLEQRRLDRMTARDSEEAAEDLRRVG